jgi:hypothetical protein
MFTDEEVWTVIKEMPKDRAPGLDGFCGSFFQKAWPWIKRDIMCVIHKLYVGDGRGFQKLNRADHAHPQEEGCLGGRGL